MRQGEKRSEIEDATIVFRVDATKDPTTDDDDDDDRRSSSSRASS